MLETWWMKALVTLELKDRAQKDRGPEVLQAHQAWPLGIIKVAGKTKAFLIVKSKEQIFLYVCVCVLPWSSKHLK